MGYKFNPFTGNFDYDSSGGAAPSDAQYLTLAVDSTLTSERVLTGTANQIIITDNGAGSTVVLSLPQDIATTSRPTFAGVLTNSFIEFNDSASPSTGVEAIWSPTGLGTMVIQAGSSVTLQADEDASGVGTLIFRTAATNRMTITNAGVAQIGTIGTVLGTAFLQIEGGDIYIGKGGADPAANAEMGKYAFFSTDTSSGARLEAGSVSMEYVNNWTATSSTWDSRMKFNTINNGTVGTALTLDNVGAATLVGSLTVATDSLFVDSAENQIGIGTVDPALTSGSSGAHVYADGSIAEYRATAFRTSTPRAFVRLQGAAGTAASPTLAAAGTEFGVVRGEGYGTTTFFRSCEISFQGGAGTFSDTSIPGRIVLLTAPDGTIVPTEKLRIDPSGIVINENSADFDFRIESDTNANAFFLDAGNSYVGINNGSPTVALDVTGAILASLSVLSASPTAGVGYGAGAGGTVTQATNKATGVTLNKVCGNITMNGAALAGDTSVTFVVTNSAVAAGDVVAVQHNSAGTLGSYTITPNTMGAGSFSITVRNITTGSLSEAIVLKFAVIKAVTA